MYLTRSELVDLLKLPYFNTFFTKNVHNYALYRGHFNATVLTLKYSVLVPEFNETSMINSIIKEVLDFFPPNIKSVRALIDYDVVLKSNPMDQVNESFYLWKANSNRNQVPNQETIVSLDENSIFLFVRHAARVNPSELDIYYINSNVSVDRIVSILFTFISI
jgi:hypothetical protein